MSNLPGIAKGLATSPPLYQQIAEDIRSSVRKGVYRPGTMIPPESRIVDQYGVSRLTVRRAFQELIAEGVLVGRRGKGTFVSDARFTGSFSLLFVHSTESAITSPYTARVFQGIQNVNPPAAPFRIELLALPPASLQSPADTTLEDLVEHGRLDGVVSIQEMWPQTLARLSAKQVPFVQIGNYPGPLPPGVASIRLGPVDQVEVMLRHLQETGRERIAFIAQPITKRSRNIDTARACMERLGLVFHQHLFEPTGWGIKSGRDTARRLLERDPNIDAILGADDFHALGALQHATEAGLSVPDDLAIAGLGNFLEGNSDCGISTVELHLEKAARAAVESLRRLIMGDETDATVEIQPSLVRRDTT